MMRNIIRGVCIVVIVVCTLLGSYMVFMHQDEDTLFGVQMVMLLYDYDKYEEVQGRQERIAALCSQEAFDLLGCHNEQHWSASYRRIGNYPCRVRIVFTRPGLVIYSLDTAQIYSTDLWCFTYELQGGQFTNVREYNLAGTWSDSKGGLLRVNSDT